MHHPNQIVPLGESYRWDVFISYSAKERSWIRRIVRQWRELGLSVFFDEDSGLPGEPVVGLIRRGHENSRHIVCMLSRVSLDSDWVELEIALSRTDDPSGRKRRLIPVLLEEISDDELRPFRHLNCVRLADPEIRDDEYRRLLSSLGVTEPGRAVLPPITASFEPTTSPGGTARPEHAGHSGLGSTFTPQEVWARILQDAYAVLPEAAFRTWLAPTQAVALAGGLLVITTPNPFAVDWIEDKYADFLATIGEKHFGFRFRISVNFQSAPTSGALPALPAQAPTQPPTPNSVSPGAPVATEPKAVLKPRYTFGRFVVGNNNQLAAAAAHAVAEAPAKMYNPLFIYGGVGLGKTHLMHAIGNALLEREPGKTVMYLSSERFTNELVSAIQDGTMADFRRRYRRIDLLLVDDIQFLEGKERTQEEMFHTFNALHDGESQIVLTSDRPPKETGLEERLVSRFEWGLVARIDPPDFETRLAILRRKVEEDRLVIRNADDVLTFIAHSRTSSVREIEGAFIKLLAYSSLTRRPIDLTLAIEALGGIPLPGGGRGSLQPELVLARVAAAWGTTSEALRSKKRIRDLATAREAAMYLMRELLDLPLVEIGRIFGGRDKSTVIASIKRAEEEMSADVPLRQRVETIRRSILTE